MQTCKSSNEYIIYIIASCSMMSVRYYLPLRHDVIAEIAYNAIIHNKSPLSRKHLESPEDIHKEGNLEYWWNISTENTAQQTPFTSLGLR